VKKFFLILLPALVFTGLIGCQKKADQSVPVTPGVTVDRVDNIAVVALGVPDFAGLNAEDRFALYYLNEAVKTGRSIALSQIYVRHEDILPFLEEIALGLGYGAPPEIVDSYWDYLKRIWLNSGFYDLKTLAKIKPTIASHDLSTIMYVALSNLGGRIGDVTAINYKESWVTGVLLSPFAESELIWTNSKGELDYNSKPVPNFYKNLKLGEAKAFAGEFPHNSYLVKEDDHVLEWVYRTGNEKLARGPYADQLVRIIENLENGRPHLSGYQVDALDLLVEHFTTGDWEKYLQAQRLLAKEIFPLEFVLGFSDVRFDPLKQKDLWTGILGISDKSADARYNEIKKSLLTASKLPGLSLRPVAADVTVKAVELIDSYGPNAPRCPDFFVLSPGGDKPLEILIFTNVIVERLKAEKKWFDEWLKGTETEQPNQEELKQAFLDEEYLRVLSGNAVLEYNYPFTYTHFNQDLEEAQIKHLHNELSLLRQQINDLDKQNSGLLKDYLNHLVKRVVVSLIPNDTGTNLRQGSYRIIGQYLIENGLLNVSGNGTEFHYTTPALNELNTALNQLILLVEDLSRASAAERSKFLKRYTVPMSSLESIIPPDSKGQVTPVTEIAFLLPDLKAEYNKMGGIDDVKLIYQPGFAQSEFAESGWPESDYKDLGIPTGVEK